MTEENIKQLEEMAERLRRIVERFERTKLLAMPGSLTQDHSRPRWERPDALDKDYEEYIDEMSVGGKTYRERR